MEKPQKLEPTQILCHMVVGLISLLLDFKQFTILYLGPK